MIIIFEKNNNHVKNAVEGFKKLKSKLTGRKTKMSGKSEKLKMHTVDKVDENIKKIGKLFPNCITEKKFGGGGVLKAAIDFDVLKQELSDCLVEGNEERYQFTWPDKRKSILLANAPINKTLRPCREESVDFDNTENLYIEGDNLEVLKLLQETYLGKIKMIYIDPPYNTGNDFVYNDDFRVESGVWRAESGDYDEHGNRLVKNLDSNGRFHTDWLNMIYPRLKLAKDLLSDDGGIFISIDDYENDNLKKLCNEVFGSQNFIACVVWQRNYAPISLKKYFSESHEYCFVYAKNKENFKMNLLPRSDKQNKDYKNPDNDPRGVWKVGNLTVGPAVEKQIYEITGPTGKKFMPPSGYCWRFTKEKFEKMRADNRIWFGSDGNNSPVPKLFLSEVQDGVTPMTLWTFDEAGHNQIATRELRDIFNGAIFTSPKPIKYITRYLQIGMNKDDTILDFFSGSATTAHAVMQLNAEDGGNRKFIMVQLPEKTDEKSEAYKAGYKNICEIGKERIRRAGKKILDECGVSSVESGVENVNDSTLQTPNSTLDIGFRVLKCDTTNMKDVYYTPDELDPSIFDNLVDNIKEDRSPEDLLFQVMLDLGILLSSKIKCEVLRVECGVENANDSTLKTQNSKLFKYFDVADGFLIACFDKEITAEVITEIAKKQPYYFVMRDNGFADDSVATNFEQIFATYSPDTIKKVL